jgi:hypothetical protein
MSVKAIYRQLNNGNRMMTTTSSKMAISSQLPRSDPLKVVPQEGEWNKKRKE